MQENSKSTKKTGDKAAYLRRYRHDHPDKYFNSRIRAAVNLLTRLGYTVTCPDEVKEG